MSDSPAYGALEVSKVAAGTGQALPGPAACGLLLPERNLLYPAKPGKWIAGRWASEAAVVPVEPSGQSNPGDLPKIS